MDPRQKTKILGQLKADFGQFSPRMTMIAKYIIDNQSDFGMDTIRETAKKSGVSTFTLLRLAEKLGFSSYSELRAPFRQALISSEGVFDDQQWIEELQNSGIFGNVHSAAARNSVNLVHRSLERQDPKSLERVVSAMHSARNIYVTAVRASFSAAYYFHYVGRMALPNMSLIPRHFSSAIDDLFEANEDDVLIAISVRPYSRETIEACAYAATRGVKVIFITDSDIVTSEFEPDETLVISAASSHQFASFTGLFALFEQLVALLFAAGGADSRERIDAYSEMRAANNAYWRQQK